MPGRVLFRQGDLTQRRNRRYPVSAVKYHWSSRRETPHKRSRPSRRNPRGSDRSSSGVDTARAGSVLKGPITGNIAMRRPLPPSRYRRIAKWVGLVLCVVILAVWAVSTRMGVVYICGNGQFGCREGQINVRWLVPGDPSYKPSWVVWKTDFEPGLMLPRMMFPSVQFDVMIDIPFWFLLTLAGIPTAILWRRDRRTVKPGHCLTCGYDLRASKKTCPECGTDVATGEPRARRVQGERVY